MFGTSPFRTWLLHEDLVGFLKRSLARIVIKSITHLFILSANFGLKVRTHKQKISWYWIWKLALPLRTDSRVEIPSTEMKAALYSSIRSIICRQRPTLCMYSLFYNKKKGDTRVANHDGVKKEGHWKDFKKWDKYSLVQLYFPYCRRNLIDIPSLHLFHTYSTIIWIIFFF